MASMDDTADENEEVQLDAEVFLVPSVIAGDRCKVGDRWADVKYVGPLQGMPKGYWVGVQYDDKVGKNDGRLVNGKKSGARYFRCPPGHGGFVRGTKVSKQHKEPKTIATGNELKVEPDCSVNAALNEPPGMGGEDCMDGATRGAAEENEKDRQDILGQHALDSIISHMDTAAASSRNKASYRLGDSRASRIAKRRKERPRSERGTLSPERSDLWVRSLESWKQDIAPYRQQNQATPHTTYATGQGLQTSVVGSLAQFTIFSRDFNSNPCETGGEEFSVTMRGRSSEKALGPPMTIRTKTIDRGDGTYASEYKTWNTGSFVINVTLDGCNIQGSPFQVSIITLRPDPAQCVLRGEALHSAIARTPMKFEVLFVDATGHPTQAEDLDVYLESMDEVSKDQNAEGSPAHGDLLIASTEGMHALLSSPASRGPSPPPYSPGRGPSSPGRSANSPVRQARRTSLQPRAAPPLLDASTRQRHMQLWSLRSTADKLQNRAHTESLNNEGGRRKQMDSLQPTSYAHEMVIDEFGFAFGGVDPGTLHAHGKLVKVHHVHYSVGLAGQYKLHVGLRHQMTPLPGSPFALLVEPGHAYATSCKIPLSAQHMRGIAVKEWQHGLVLKTADMLGNACTKGGANVTMRLSNTKKREANDAKDADPELRTGPAPVEFQVSDSGDGSYALSWKSEKAGMYNIDVLLDGSHSSGSPIQLQVRAAVPAVEKMEVSGPGIVKAIAGEKAIMKIDVADRFGNKIDLLSSSFPYDLGLVVTPAGGATLTTVADTKIKAVKGGSKADDKRSNKEDERKTASISFEEKMVGSVVEIGYVAEAAGSMELHVWAALKTSVAADAEAQGKAAGTREPLPGSPFLIHVTEGNASATGSSVGEAEAPAKGAGFVAGEHIILKPQIRDDFGNMSAAAEGSLSVEHKKPGVDGQGEELAPPKAKGALGLYELAVEPTKAGVHQVHIKLNGHDIRDSPVSFSVAPAAAAASKCKLTRGEPPESEALLEKQPFTIRATLFDKYGNQLDHGGVRVDAKASGVGVSGAKVEDMKDGTYTISLTAGPPGEIKITVRIDGTDLPPFVVTVIKNPEAQQAEQAAAIKELDGKEAEQAAKDKEREPQKDNSAKDGAKLAKMKAAAEASPGVNPAEAEAEVKTCGFRGWSDIRAKIADGSMATFAAEVEESTGEVFKEVKWMTSESILKLIGPLKAEIDDLAVQAEKLSDTFDHMLGVAILAKLGKVGKVEDLLREWDGNGDVNMPCDDSLIIVPSLKAHASISNSDMLRVT